MEVQELISRLEQISEISDKIWINGLEDRKKKELEFSDQHRDKSDQDTYEKIYTNRKYYMAVAKSNEYTNQWIIKNAKNNIFLDLACGDGQGALKAAKAGAKLAIGLDLSAVSIQDAKNEAEKLGLSNTFFLRADAENTNLPDSCIDRVICSGMLHHLDLSYAFPELRRILAPNGRVLAIEALDYNPMIKLYRMLTPDIRTEWEKAHILDMHDIKFAKRFFRIGDVKFWHITSYVAAFIPIPLPILDAIDAVLSRIPLLRLMAWIFTFELVSDKASTNQNQ